MGFAIPIDLAIPVADQLITSGRALHPDLGLTAQELVVPAAQVPEGLFVTTVDPAGPADQAGVKVGDVIVEIDGEPARSLEQLVVTTLRHDVGDTVDLTIWRTGETTQAKVVLGVPR